MSGPDYITFWWVFLKVPQGQEPGLQKELPNVALEIVSWAA